jgi:hypothetical protein
MVIWDEEVDVVCTGSGVAGLATAISVVDVGGAVFVADSSGDRADDAPRPVRARVDRLGPWLGAEVRDPETNDYLAALSADLGPLRRSRWDVDVPIRVVRQPVSVDSRGTTVAPFVGARLRDWAARCLASPYGFIYTRVRDWQSTTLHSADGEAIEVAEIGMMAPDPGNVCGSVYEWLTAQAHDRRIGVHPGSSLQRIVFEDGAVVGAVFSTPAGPLAVRARHGVTVAIGGPQINGAQYHQPVGDAALRVCLVGQAASRFGRVELLTSETHAQPVTPTCRPVNRQLHADLHQTHTDLHAWRCGKVDGYPPRSQ